MFSSRPTLAFAYVCALACGTAPSSALLTVQDQSDPDLSAQFAISSFLAADDLNFPVSSRIDTVTVWITDNVANDNGVLDGFSGSLSWAVYSDVSGPSGALNTGIDVTPLLEDTGLQTTSGSDVFRVRIDLDGRPIVGPARVWLVIHEGPWGSPTDGSGIYWLASASTAGSTAYVTANETNPAPNEWFLSNYDAAFVVESDPHDWFQGFIHTQSGGNISSYISASDFFLATPRRIDSLDAWLGDVGPENGQLDFFSGTLSWAIYSDASGDPGTLVASGTDSTPSLLDSGLNFNSGGDIVRVRIELSPAPNLAAGTWWLALHEGAWGSASDGSNVSWVMYPSTFNSTSRQAEDETNPGSWYELFSAHDLAFVLFDDSIFASGFDAGVTCAWSAATGGPTCP
ncbi:MAG: hypothetical protein QG573_2659 [Acidobacteriota bacterium]|nr:hypothetical protein [Acidobacteriota bacterium]